MLSCVTHVFLDVDNTLLDFEACAEQASLSALKAWGIDTSRFDFRVFTEINNALWAALERGEIERGEIHRTRWSRIFSALGIEADGEAFEYAFLAAIPSHVVPVEGALELLSYLAKKYPLFAASNAPHAQQLNRLKSAGMLDFFKDVFTSERLGAAKPSSAFFEGVFSALPEAKPGECVMIGDSYEADILGAARAGMQTIFFDIRDTRREVPLADESVRRLAEIKLFL